MANRLFIEYGRKNIAEITDLGIPFMIDLSLPVNCKEYKIYTVTRFLSGERTKKIFKGKRLQPVADLIAWRFENFHCYNPYQMTEAELIAEYCNK